MHKKKNNDFDNKNRIETRANKPINSNKQIINNILYFINFIIGNLIENCKFYRFYNI